jgi:hypothetical protein
MILHPDMAIDLLREMQSRDLALIAIVAGMQDSEDEAVARLGEIEQAMREWRASTPRRSADSHRKADIADDVIQIAPRLANAIRQIQAVRAA